MATSTTLPATQEMPEVGRPTATLAQLPLTVAMLARQAVGQQAPGRAMGIMLVHVRTAGVAIITKTAVRLRLHRAIVRGQAAHRHRIVRTITIRATTAATVVIIRLPAKTAGEPTRHRAIMEEATETVSQVTRLLSNSNVAPTKAAQVTRLLSSKANPVTRLRRAMVVHAEGAVPQLRRVVVARRAEVDHAVPAKSRS